MTVAEVTWLVFVIYSIENGHLLFDRKLLIKRTTLIELWVDYCCPPPRFEVTTRVCGLFMRVCSLHFGNSEKHMSYFECIQKKMQARSFSEKEKH